MFKDLDSSGAIDSIPCQLSTDETRYTFDPVSTIHALFERQVDLQPEKTAIVSDESSLTYAQLNNYANKIALNLKAKGVGVGDSIVIHMDSSVETIVSILAVLKVGAAYIPIGMECPSSRLSAILEDCSAIAMLVASDISIDVPTNQLVRVDKLLFDDSEIYYNLNTEVSARDLAYIIYTSGTTGRPKGVLLEHRAVNNYVTWAANTYVKDEESVFPFYTSISFDMTVTSIFVPLITGNRIRVYSSHVNGFALDAVLEDNVATVLKLTPSHLRLIKNRDLSNSRIRSLVVGGENLPTDLAETMIHVFGSVAIYNEYGPTEATVGSMIHLYKVGRDQGPSIPIGEAIANTQIYLLNDNFEPVTPGEEGEIFIGGMGLARGYLNRPELNAASFIDNPFVSGEKMYRTGDLASIDKLTGAMKYVGRRDDQVKIRGYRVEVAEIEAKIEAYQRTMHLESIEHMTTAAEPSYESLDRCRICIDTISSEYKEMHDGVCKTCLEFQSYKAESDNYFSEKHEFFKLVRSSPNFGDGDYDVLLCFSGGKDSTYVLHQLIENGLRVLAFTFDNGYISRGAFDNMRTATDMLGADLVILDTESIKDIFIDSLIEESNVCNGCFKSINTLAIQLAWKHNIGFVISGLSRGQIFEIDLHGFFKLRVFDEEEIEKRKLEYRKRYFSKSNRVSRLLNVDVSDEMIERVSFINYFRYDDIATDQVIEFLADPKRKWIRPMDTGSSSTNCRLNDASIYFHVLKKGDHFYTPQLSWDIRLNTVSRSHALKEISGFEIIEGRGKEILSELGYFQPKTGSVIKTIDMGNLQGQELVAYVVADAAMNIPNLKAYLTAELPSYMVPSYILPIDKIPLNAIGKVDNKRLLDPRGNAEPIKIVEQPPMIESELTNKLVDIWVDILCVSKEEVALNVDFFDQGGHSFRFVMMIAKIQEEFDCVLEPDLSKPTTILSLSKNITSLKH